MQTILLVPTRSGVGLTSACLGLIQALDYIGLKAGFIKPFDDKFEGSKESMHSSGALIKQIFGIVPPPSISRHHLEKRLGDGEIDDLMEEVVGYHQSLLANDIDLIVCEGVVPSADAAYAAQVNLALANALDANVILVSTADMEDPKRLASHLDVHTQEFGGLSSDRTLGCILMRVKNMPNTFETQPVEAGYSKFQIDPSFVKSVQYLSPHFESERFRLLGAVPFSNALSVPRTWDIAQALGAKWLNEGEAKNRRVITKILAARTVSNIGSIFNRGALLITPGDRDDILLATALAAMNGVPLAGLVLTGDMTPNDNMIALCQPALKTGLPIMQVDTDSFQTIYNLSSINSEIPVDDSGRAQEVARFVAAHINLDWLKAYFQRGYSPRLSPSAFRHKVVKLAQSKKMRIALPEGDEPRTVEAAIICQSRGIADCVLLAKREDVVSVAQNLNMAIPEGLQIIEPTTIAHRYVAPMVERRQGKLTDVMAESQLKDAVVVATMMLHQGEVDGLVSGAVHSTANTVRPAFQLIKTSPDYSLVSSVFFMLLSEQVVVYGDCAINPNPNAQALAEIAIQSAASAKKFGINPKIAMISYSTGTSGSGDDVEKVKLATEIVRQRCPELVIDGPLQYDAAFVSSVGKQKAPNSPVAGQANVFIFPDLNTGNTTYKAVQRSAKVVSVGPMLQGLNKPVNDLSRGALVDDIVYTIALTAIQAQKN